MGPPNKKARRLPALFLAGDTQRALAAGTPTQNVGAGKKAAKNRPHFVVALSRLSSA